MLPTSLSCYRVNSGEHVCHGCVPALSPVPGAGEVLDTCLLSETTRSVSKCLHMQRKAHRLQRTVYTRKEQGAGNMAELRHQNMFLSVSLPQFPDLPHEDRTAGILHVTEPLRARVLCYPVLGFSISISFILGYTSPLQSPHKPWHVLAGLGSV